MRSLLLLLLLLMPAWARKVPSDRPTDMERGQELYARHCQACHGPTNHGDGPAAAALVQPVPDLAGAIDAVERQARKPTEATPQPTGMISRVDEEVVTAVLEGHGTMPAYADTLSRSDARRVVFYQAFAHVPDPPKDETDENDEKSQEVDAEADD